MYLKMDIKIMECGLLKIMIEFVDVKLGIATIQLQDIFYWSWSISN